MPPTDEKGHFTAVVEILHSTPKRVGGVRDGRLLESGEREKREVARFIVRSDSIDDLTAKVQAHLALVKDYE